MKKQSSSQSLLSLNVLLIAALVLFGLSAASLHADQVIIQAGSGGTGAGYADGSGSSTAGGFTGTTSTSYQCTGLNPNPYTGGYTGVRYNAGGGTVGVNPYIILKPTIAPSGDSINPYNIYIVYGASASDASKGTGTYSMNYVNCVGKSGNTTFFRNGGTLNAWVAITTVAVNPGVTTPSVKFINAAGSTSRTYSGVYYFNQTFAAAVTGINPVAAGDTSVTVLGCNAGAADVRVYDVTAGWILLGQNSAPGGASTVAVSGINGADVIAGHQLAALQNVPVTLNSTAYGRLGSQSAAPTVTVTSGVDPCTTVAVVGGITKSPLAPSGYIYSDVTTITCTGCSGSATAVTIRDTSNGDAVVGTATGGSSTVTVNVSGLTTGHILCAVQTVGGQDSCVAGAPTVTVGNSSCTYVAAVGGVSIVDPITAGDTSVTVTGVSASAQDVTVYANGVQIGQNAAPGGATTVVVTTSPLVKGRYLTASQKLSDTEGCIPGSTGAPIVGGGNAALTVCLEFNVGGTPYLWLGANGRQGGYASPPTGATVVSPSIFWQTVSWTPGTSPSWNWGTASAYTFPTSGSGTLQYIWLCPNDNTEMGPYTVYIDTVKNGTSTLYNWDGDTLGNSAFMQQPSYASTGRTPIHDNPNATLCVNTFADTGAKCQKMDWEWVNNGVNNSMRGTLKGGGISVDLSQPISFRILVLPPGVSAPDYPPTSPNLTASTGKNQPLVLTFDKLLAKASDADEGDTLSVTAAGPTSANGPANNVVLNSGAGTITYTPQTDYTGPDSFSYTISDSHGGTVTPTVNVAVNANSGGSPNVVSAPTYADGKFSVTFAGIPGVEYTAEYAANAPMPPWNKLKNVTAGSNGLFVVEDEQGSSDPSRYYRIVHPSY